MASPYNSSVIESSLVQQGSFKLQVVKKIEGSMFNVFIFNGLYYVTIFYPLNF
jgi:hypothetical protein